MAAYLLRKKTFSKGRRLEVRGGCAGVGGGGRGGVGCDYGGAVVPVEVAYRLPPVGGVGPPAGGVGDGGLLF